MSINEILARYSVRTYIPSKGQNITQIAHHLYDSGNPSALYLLQELNRRLDWDSIIDISTPIRYVSKQALNDVTFPKNY